MLNANLRELLSERFAVDDEFTAAVFDGLSRPQKTLPCRFFYDARGSELDVFQGNGQRGHHAARRRSIQSRVRYQAPIMGKNHGSPL